MGKVIMSGIVPQLAEPVTFKANFADNDWATIIDAVQKNKVPDTWEVGDQKSMTINGKSYAIDIIGKNHDDYADGTGKAPLTFQLHDLYGTNYRMHSSASNSTDGWRFCEMRTTSLPAILKLMPIEVQNGIKKVNKSTTIGTGSNTINTIADTLFLLSEIEVFGSLSYSYAGEGQQYDYYKAGNSKIKSAKYWLRSPYKNSNDSYCYVGDFGFAYTTAATSMGVAFAFCF